MSYGDWRSDSLPNLVTKNYNITYITTKKELKKHVLDIKWKFAVFLELLKSITTQSNKCFHFNFRDIA